MPLTVTGMNAMLDHLASLVDFAALHDGFPGETALNEISGGTPAYARKAMTWNAAAAGNLDSDAQPVFDIPAGTTVRWWSGMTAVTGSTSHVYGPLGGSPYDYTVNTTRDVVTAPGHPFANDDTIVFYGGTPPGGLTKGTVYYARDVSGDDFKVAATQGGAAIDLTSAGDADCVVSKIVPETHAGQGTYTLTDADITLGTVGD